MTAVPALHEVTRRYRRGREVVTAVDRVSFTLDDASMTALVGPSGAGKTTLLNLVLGGDRPNEGTIDGVPRRPTWSDLAVVPQGIGLLPELSIAENVDLPRRLGAVPARPVTDVLAQLGLAALADRPPAETSLGEQQRAAIARAIVSAPRLVVADEPTAHQDEANADRVVGAMAELAAQGTCVLLSTHDPRVVAGCEHVLRMRDGAVTRER